MSFYQLSSGFSRFQQVPMAFDDSSWWNAVPGVPGWYLIETDTPVEVLGQLPIPPEGTNIYNIPDRIQSNAWLLAQGLAIQPTQEGVSYVVYSGEQFNLKNRAREHTRGNNGTGCLCLSQYPQLHQYQWSFLYLSCDTVFPGNQGDKALRVFWEQTWRALNGWPILCKE